jgi:hypothetical protein
VQQQGQAIRYNLLLRCASQKDFHSHPSRKIGTTTTRISTLIFKKHPANKNFSYWFVRKILIYLKEIRSDHCQTYLSKFGVIGLIL